MKFSNQHAQNFRGVTEVKHIVISLTLIAASLTAGMWLRGGSETSSNPSAVSPAAAAGGSQFSITPTAESMKLETKPAPSGKAVAMTPEIKKFADSCKLLTEALTAARPDIPVAKAALKDMSLRFEEDPVAQGTFLHQVRTLPANAIPTMLSVMDLPIDSKIRAILLHKMFTIQMPHVNSALNEWLTNTKDLSLLEEGLNAVQFVPEKDTFLKALIVLTKEDRSGGIKLPPSLRWLVADAIFDAGRPESKTALTAIAEKDSDEKIRAHAADLVKALTPSENCVMVLGNKKWSDENKVNPLLQPGDMLISCNNVTCDFPDQVRNDLAKKKAESTLTLVLRRAGVDCSLKSTAAELAAQLSNLKLHTARVNTSLTVEKSSDGF